ncbi:MAG: F0F1 ATP synthase subunit delta [Verrucomicrobia bacterium]|nr:F0F1 ATP synthase subunit delta [Verrucomicrobiota bacterium]
MTTSREARRIARALFRESFTDGRLDEAKVRQAIQQLAAARPRMLVAILKSYERLVRLEVERNTARVESAAELDAALRGRLTAQLQQIYRRPVAAEFNVNPELIGGVRVRIGSDVWDGSVSGRLRELSAAL